MHMLQTDVNNCCYLRARSGKSSFVDAVEYILQKGRIEHLSVEYADSGLRNCIRNTFAPDGEDSRAFIHFIDGNNVFALVPSNGRILFKGSREGSIDEVQEWEKSGR